MGGLIAWRSKGQKPTALSSTEAEGCSCSEGVKEITFIVQILLFLGVAVELPVDVFIDNVGAIYLFENAGSSNRTRHIDARTQFVRDLQDQELLKVKFVKSEDNPADVATKNVNGDTFDKHLPMYAATKDYLD